MLTGLQTRLQALVWPGTANQVFTRVLLAIDLRSPETVFSTPSAVLYVRSFQYDGENPNLGTYQIGCELFATDYTQPRGGRQLSGDLTLIDAVNVIRDEMGHSSFGTSMAGVTLTGHTDPMAARLADNSRGAIWALTCNFEVIRG